MQLLNADPIFKTFLKTFFAPENMKKPPSKVAHNRPHFFFSTAKNGLVCPNSRKPN
jgi:hypothetical protein